MSDDRLVRMANQIAVAMASKPAAEAAAGVAAHISDYWEPRMRLALLRLIAAGVADLHPLLRAAAPLIRRPAAVRG